MKVSFFASTYAVSLISTVPYLCLHTSLESCIKHYFLWILPWIFHSSVLGCVLFCFVFFPPLLPKYLYLNYNESLLFMYYIFENLLTCYNLFVTPKSMLTTLLKFSTGIWISFAQASVVLLAMSSMLTNLQYI